MTKKTTRESKSKLAEKLASSSKVKRVRRSSRDSTNGPATYSGSSGYSGSSYFDPSQSDLERRDYNWERGYR